MPKTAATGVQKRGRRAVQAATVCAAPTEAPRERPERRSARSVAAAHPQATLAGERAHADGNVAKQADTGVHSHHTLSVHGFMFLSIKEYRLVSCLMGRVATLLYYVYVTDYLPQVQRKLRQAVGQLASQPSAEGKRQRMRKLMIGPCRSQFCLRRQACWRRSG